MDRRIEEFIRANRGTLTREAIRTQLLEAGYDAADIDATWEALHAPDPDSPPAGQGFWSRFWLMLLGVNVGVLLLVGVGTGALFRADTVGLLGILAVMLAIGALIAWGIVAATGPDRMARTPATVIGLVIPLIFALLIGGACYALVGSLGPPPRSGSFDLRVESPTDLEASGTATCYESRGSNQPWSMFGQQESSGGYLTVSADNYVEGAGIGGTDIPNVSVSLESGSGAQPPRSWSSYAGPADIEAQVSDDGLVGSVTFSDLQSDMSGTEFEGEPPEPISGSITWTCE